MTYLQKETCIIKKWHMVQNLEKSDSSEQGFPLKLNYSFRVTVESYCIKVGMHLSINPDRLIYPKNMHLIIL